MLLKSISDEASLNLAFRHLDFILDYCMPKAIIADEDDGSKAEYAPTSSNISLIQNIRFPPKREVDHFAYEDPLNMNVEKLAFTSGKKLW